jgi:chromate transporter
LGIGLSFSGLATVPILRESLVLDQGLLTDARLNDIAISQASPGPLGMYVVLVRYFVSGVPGALTGVLASGPIPWQSSLTLPNL